MQKIFRSGAPFLVLAIAFLAIGISVGKYAIYLPLAVVFFVLGLALRKRGTGTSETKTGP